MRDMRASGFKCDAASDTYHECLGEALSLNITTFRQAPAARDVWAGEFECDAASDIICIMSAWEWLF